MSVSTTAGPWRAQLSDIVRAASGGLLFGVPLLYTMEVWWTGSHTGPAQMLIVLAVLSIPVLVLNRTEGFRRKPDVRIRDAAADTVEALAVGIAVTAVVLTLLREITPDTPLAASLGKVVYECVPFCLGIGLARHFLQRGRAAPDDGEKGPTNATLADVGATVLGAIFISLSIAPTDEVPMIASAMSPSWVIALMAASLVTSYIIVFAADFTGQDARHTQEGAFQAPLSETIVTYLISLAVAALLLWLFQRGAAPTTDFLNRVVVLGFPAAVGGAAGRLAV